LTTRTWRAKRRIGLAAVLALLGSVLFASPAAAYDEGERFGGANRYETAANVATSDQWLSWGTSALTIVTGENFPDGLAAAALGQPVLLVTKNSIPASTAAAIGAWVVKNSGGIDIDVVGGTGVISSDVYESLETLAGSGSVTRHAGADRYATALKVAAATGISNPCDVILATGQNFPDALAAGPLSMEANAPILLNDGASLRADVAAYIAAMGSGGGCVLGAPTVHIIGGTSAVPASIEAQILSMGIAPNRISGANRYETAAGIMAVLSGIDTIETIVLVNGSTYADALSAGPFTGEYFDREDGTGILLVETNSIPAATAAAHVTYACDDVDPESIYVIGGSAAVSSEVRDAAQAAVECVPPTYTASVATVANTQQVYEVTDSGAGGNITAGNGVTLTAVAGSAADGVGHLRFPITIVDAGADPTSSAVSIPGTSLTVEIKGLASGMTQQAFADEWNSTPAGALFTAAPNVPAVFGPPTAFDGSDAAAAPVTGKTGLTTQVLTLQFDQDVNNCAGTPTVIDTTDLTGEPGSPVATTLSPIAGTPGSEDTYVWTFTVAALGDVMSVGDNVNAVASSICSAANGESVSTANVKLTAG
jgi:putative cell wall-binding protein